MRKLRAALAGSNNRVASLERSLRVMASRNKRLKAKLKLCPGDRSDTGSDGDVDSAKENLSTRFDVASVMPESPGAARRHSAGVAAAKPTWAPRFGGEDEDGQRGALRPHPVAASPASVSPAPAHASPQQGFTAPRARKSPQRLSASRPQRHPQPAPPKDPKDDGVGVRLAGSGSGGSSSNSGGGGSHMVGHGALLTVAPDATSQRGRRPDHPNKPRSDTRRSRSVSVHQRAPTSHYASGGARRACSASPKPASSPSPSSSPQRGRRGPPPSRRCSHGSGYGARHSQMRRYRNDEQHRRARSVSAGRQSAAADDTAAPLFRYNPRDPRFVALSTARHRIRELRSEVQHLRSSPRSNRYKPRPLGDQ